MTSKSLLRKIENLENNARRLMDDAAALKEELSGGADSSISIPALSNSQIELLLKNRRKTALKR